MLEGFFFSPTTTCGFALGLSEPSVRWVKGKGKVIPLPAQCGPEGGSACNNSAPTGWTFMKFDTLVFL